MSVQGFIFRRWIRALSAALFCCALLPGIARAQDDTRQYKIEAAYLYNFLNYITWPGFATPQDLHQPVICLYEEDKVEPYLEYIQHRRSSEHEIVIRHIAPGAVMDGCNIIFLGERLPEETGVNVNVPGALVVSGKENSINHGVMIELFKTEERIRMKINQTLLDNAHFQASSRLLSLAEELKK